MSEGAAEWPYRSDSRRVLATLIRLLGDFDLAEEALHKAFTAAVEQWPRDGVPANPRAWLVSAGRFKAIDAIRRRARFDASLTELAERAAYYKKRKPIGKAAAPLTYAGQEPLPQPCLRPLDLPRIAPEQVRLARVFDSASHDSASVDALSGCCCVCPCGSRSSRSRISQ
jgi:RNA polymerase sigma-70 factor, ECF subfamily